MTLPNSLIIALGNNGIGGTTEHSLRGESAYNAFRFRRSLMKAYNELANRQAELRKEAGDDDARFRELNEALLKDESEVWATPLPVQDFLALAGENKRTRIPSEKELYIDIFRVFENDLEGILWTDNYND